MIGIGIITRNRRDCVIRVVDAVQRHTTSDYELVVGVDHTEDDTADVLAARGVKTVFPVRRGIPANRNVVLAALRQHEVIFLLEDDNLPIADGWDVPYVQAVMHTPVKVLLNLNHTAGDFCELNTFDGPDGPITVGLRPNMGCTLAVMHQDVLDVVGGWDERFGSKYGLDDGQWMVRCKRAGLAGEAWGFPCLPEADQLTRMIEDPPSSDGKTHEERLQDIKDNMSIFQNRFTDPIFVPLPEV